MSNKDYIKRRAELVAEVNRLYTIHCPLSAQARIRRIADLDFQFCGTDKQTTIKSLTKNK